MKLLVESLVIFFGTLLAAALVAFGEPGQVEVDMARAAGSQPAPTVAHWMAPR